MVRTLVAKSYVCETCGTPYLDREDAENCEDIGIYKIVITSLNGKLTQEWQTYDMVLNFVNGKLMQIVGNETVGHVIYPIVCEMNGEEYRPDNYDSRVCDLIHIPPNHVKDFVGSFDAFRDKINEQIAKMNEE